MGDWVDDRSAIGAGRRGGADAAARARAAREQRAAGQQRAAEDQKVAQQAAAAATLQRAARHHGRTVSARALMRSEWDAALASVSIPPPAGQQVVLAAWLLRFFACGADGDRVRSLCRILKAGLDQEQAPLSFASVALKRELAFLWADTLRKLVIAVSRLLSPKTDPSTAALLSEMARGGVGGGVVASAAALTTTRNKLSAHMGPLLLILVTLGEPEKWKLTQQLGAVAAGQPASQALVLMARSAMGAAAEPMIRALGALSVAVHSHADASLLGGAIAAACLPLQGEGAPSAGAVRAFVLGGVLGVPALPARVATAASRLAKGNLVWSRVMELGALLSGQVGLGSG